MSWDEAAIRILRMGLEALDLPALCLEQEQRFQAYADFLADYNLSVNLTAISDAKAIAQKHFLDSLSVQKLLPLKPGMKIIDIGSGAGFPGVPLLIMQPDLDLCLLDSQSKRIGFLKQLLLRLGLEATLLHARAEDTAHQTRHRARYDAAIARAVAPLPVLLEYALPFLHCGGVFIAQKGPRGIQELAEATEALRCLGGTHRRTEHFLLPAGDRIDAEEEKRFLLLFEKTAESEDLYPRTPKQMKKAPL